MDCNEHQRDSDLPSPKSAAFIIKFSRKMFQLKVVGLRKTTNETFSLRKIFAIFGKIIKSKI